MIKKNKIISNNNTNNYINNNKNIKKILNEANL